MNYCELCGDYGGHVDQGECPALDEPLFDPASPNIDPDRSTE